MRRLVVLLFLAGITVVVAGGAAPCDVMRLRPACYVALHPGPTEDTLDLVNIEGTRAYVPAGEFLLTTVAVEAELDFLEWVRGGLSPDVDQVPRETVYPTDQDASEIEEDNLERMDQSQFDAVVAALDLLGYDFETVPDGALIEAVEGTGPAHVAGLLPGDVIVAVDGNPVATADDLADVGEDSERDVVVEVQRDEVPLRLELPASAAASLVDHATVVTHVDLPVEVAIDAGAIGGPSAGLMFAVSIVELLEADDLGAGRVVAGTGSIDADGRVGAIGGVQQKVLGAQLRDEGRPASVFLVPEENLDEARNAPVARDVLLVPVATLADAVEALDQLRAGEQPVGALALAP